MGIFGFLRRKNEAVEQPQQPPQEKASVRLGELGGWLDGELGGRLEKLNEEADALCGSIIDSVDSVRESIRKLGKESFDPQDRTYARVNMAKDTFVNKSLSSLGGIRKPHKDCGYNQLLSFKSAASSSLNEIKAATPKQAFFISNYFKEQMAAIIDAIKSADSAAAELDGFLGGEGMLLKSYSEAKESAASLQRFVSEAENLRREEGEIKKQIESANSGISSSEKELESFVRSEPWQSNLSAKSRLQAASDSVKSIEQEANALLSVLRKPMKKIAHDTGSAALPENPFKEIVVSGGSVGDIIRTVLSASESHEIDLKPGEREKIVSLSASIDDLYAMRVRYLKAVAAMENEAGSIDTSLDEKKASIESGISELKSGLERARKSLTAKSDEIKRKDDEKEIRIREARGALQEAARKEVDIVVQEYSG
jgi:hypothetical protein